MKRFISFLLLLFLGVLPQANASLLSASEEFKMNAEIFYNMAELKTFNNSNINYNNNSQTIIKSGLLEHNEPLPSDEAFKTYVAAIDSQTLNVRWLIHKDYYLYKDKITITAEGANIASAIYPDTTLKNDDFFGQVNVYDRPVVIVINLENVKSESIGLNIEYQGCWSGGVCYPPQQKYYNINLPDGNLVQNNAKAKKIATTSSTAPFETMTNEEITAKDMLQKGGWALIIGAFIAGLALSYTPCVYPMVPILSGIIIGQRRPPKTLRAINMSLVFVIFMSFAYALIGATAGYFGAGVNIQTALQTPWLIALFCLVFVFLAFSMFGYYNIQPPKIFQNKITQISNKQNGGSFVGVAVMGFLSALIIGPCVTPFMATALSYVIADGSPSKGALGLFAMGLGMGVPLIVICGWGINVLPKSGAWMETIKHVFGILMLAVALYLLGRIVSPFVSLVLWAILFSIAPIALGAITPLDKQSSPWRRVFKAINLVALGYGVLLWLLVAKGGGDMYQPLTGWQYNNINEVKQSIDFEAVDSSAHLDLLLAEAQKNNKTAILKFYADWCISCKTLERTVFSKPSVIDKLGNVLAITADVTDNTASNQGLLTRFDVVGPPAILFFKNSKEVRNQRIIGEIRAKDFLERLSKI